MTEKNRLPLLFTLLASLGTLTHVSFAAAGESQVRADIEGLYAKRDQAYLAKDNTFEKSLWTDDYTSKNKEGKISTRKEAEAESDHALAMTKEFQKI
jgi:hypothetical protein